MCSCVLCSCVPSYFHKKYESTLYESTFVLSKVILSYFRTKVRKYVVRTKVRKYFLKYFRTFVRKYFRILLYFRRATRTEVTYGSTFVLSYFKYSFTVLPTTPRSSQPVKLRTSPNRPGRSAGGADDRASRTSKVCLQTVSSPTRTCTCIAVYVRVVLLPCFRK